jgi:hypothetical protein
VTGHGHGRHHDVGASPWLDFPLDAAGRRLALVAGTLVVATVVAIVWLWPSDDIELPPVLASARIERIGVTVDEIVPVECMGAPDSPIPCFSVRFAVPDGNRGDFH